MHPDDAHITKTATTGYLSAAADRITTGHVSASPLSAQSEPSVIRFDAEHTERIITLLEQVADGASGATITVGGLSLTASIYNGRVSLSIASRPY